MRARVRLAAAVLALAVFETGARAAALPGWPDGVVVREVKVEGLGRLNESDARARLAIPTGRTPDSLVVAAGVGRLAAAFEANGYLVASVDSVAARGARDGKADLVVWVTPGERQTIGHVRWDGLSHFTENEAAAISGLSSGQPFVSARVTEGLARLVRAYEERGLAAASATVLDLERHADAVDLGVRIVEGDTITVSELAFEGAHRTHTSVLEKSMGSVVGLPYNRAQLMAGRQRLADLGVFQKVGEPRAEPAGTGTARVIVPVVEATANSFDGAIGYQGDTKSLTGLADLRLGNLGGSARQLNLYWQGRGPGRSEFRVRYAEPLLLGLNLRAEALLNQLVEADLYTRTTLGLRLGFGAWSGARFWLSLARDRTVLDDGPTERAEATTSEAGFDADRRDDPFVPRRGYRVAVSTGTVFKRTFFRPEGEDKATQLVGRAWAEGNRPFGAQRTSGAKLALQGALRLTNEPVVPEYDLDLVGGTNTLRGYREGEFRTSRWAVGRLEYGVFTQEGGRAFAFLDQGVLYRPFLDSDGIPDSETLYRYGFGVGLEAVTSPGRMQLMIGWGEGDGPLDGKIHLGLTSRF